MPTFCYISAEYFFTFIVNELWLFYDGYCVTFTESEPYCHSILFVCLSVGHSADYSLPRLIDHNQIWSAGIYLSSDPYKPFWVPYLPYFRCQREKYAKFRLFPSERDASCHMTCIQW